MRAHRNAILLSLVPALLAGVRPAQAWLGKGHLRATALAIKACDDKLPRFFADKVVWVRHAAIDPDAHRHKSLVHLRDAEYPQHYFAMEIAGQLELPPARSEYLKLLARKDIEVRTAGLAPYRLAEAVQQLTYALAEYRKFPDSPIIQAKCLLLAGWVAHYAQDLCQPLHTTVHFDGRNDAEGKSPRSGIHVRVDALIEKAPAAADREAGKLQPKPIKELMGGILARIRHTHGLVDRVYELEDAIPAIDAAIEDQAVKRFAADRLRAAAAFTATLYLTAWQNSATLILPEWHIENRRLTDRP